MLDIVIVSYNCRQYLDNCLRALSVAAPVLAHRIVVVDNASTDDTVAFLRREWPSVGVIEAGGNRGFAAANNLGIRATHGEFVLLLNPDTIVPAGALERLVTALQDQADAAIAGPRIVDADGRAELSFGSMLTPLTELRQMLLVKGNDRGVRAVVHLVERLTRRPRRPDWVTGACLLIRRADLEAVGLLDERYFMYTEDVDLCASVRARGRAVLFVPSVSIVHLRGRSAATASSATRQAYQRSHMAFYRKHHPRLTPFLRAYRWLRARR